MKTHVIALLSFFAITVPQFSLPTSNQSSQEKHIDGYSRDAKKTKAQKKSETRKGRRDRKDNTQKQTQNYR